MSNRLVTKAWTSVAAARHDKERETTATGKAEISRYERAGLCVEKIGALGQE